MSEAAPAVDTILVVDDDPATRRLVRTYLEREAFRVVEAGDGAEAIRAARQGRVALVVLDLMLPQVDGLDACREIRRVSDVPILILSAKEEEFDRVLGLTLGADDYVPKPFSPRELVARVKAILRRTRRSVPRGPDPLTHGELTLDPERHEVTLGGRDVELTPSEFKILHALMSTPGRVFTRSELLTRLHAEEDAVIQRVVDVHVGKLRRKIERDPSKPSLIVTVRGVGYRLSESPDSRRTS